MRRWASAFAAGCSLLAGCYLTHPSGTGGSFDGGAERDAAPPGARDGGDRDAGPDASSGADAGPDHDAGERDSGSGSDAGPRPDAGGPPRPALRFNRGTFFEVPDAPLFDADRSSAYEMWVRARDTADADFCQKGDTLARHLFVGLRAGHIVMGWEASPVTHFVTGPEVVPDTWTHVALVTVPDAPGRHRATMYVDGAEVGRMVGGDLVRAFNAVGFICGTADVDVDEIRVWRVARSADSIRANLGHRITGGQPGLIAYWRLDERGQIALDYTASGTVGVLGRLTTPDPADPTWIADGVF